MKVLRCLLLFLIVAQATFGAVYREPSTGAVFPENCAGWKRSRVTEDPQDPSTVSIGYGNERIGAITFLIFDGRVGDARDDAEAIAKEMELIAEGIGEMWRKLGASVELALPIGPLPSDNRQLVMVHRIYLPDRPSLSITIMRFTRGRYMSVRFTTQEQDSDKAFGELGKFFAALGPSSKAEQDAEQAAAAKATKDNRMRDP